MPAPAADGEGEPGWLHFADVTAGYALSLPGAWQLLDLGAPGMAAELMARTGEGDQLAQLLPLLAAGGGELRAVGWRLSQTADTHLAYLSLAVFPAAGLTLPYYLHATATALAAREAVVLHSAGLETGWRSRGREVGILRYRLPVGPGSGVAEALQIGLLDDGGQRLLVLTGSAPAALFPTVELELRAAVETLHFPALPGQ